MGIFRRIFKRSVPVDPTTKETFRDRLSKTVDSTGKQLMWLLTINACIWIYMSYGLAWSGREQIAEALSSTICTTILGTVIAYLSTSTVSNISKYNPKFGGTPAGVKIEDVIPDEPEVEVNFDGPDDPGETNEEVVG